MTAIDLQRIGPSPADEDLASVPTARLAAARGAVAALLSAVVVVGLVVVGWVATSRSTVGLLPTLGIGVDAWLLAHGARLTVGQAHVALTPLLLWGGIVGLIGYAVTPLLPSAGSAPQPPTEPGTGEAGGSWAVRLRPVAAFGGGYAVVAVLLGLLTLAGPARPDLLLVVPALVGTLVAGVLVAAWRSAPDGDGVLALLPDRARVPGTLRRAVSPALWGAGALLATGAVVVLAAVALALGDVRHVQSELGAGLVGGLLLTVGQLLYLPNLALWAVSFTAGSGFQVVAGSPTTWDGAQAGLMPMVPVFAALPSPGGFPVVVAAVALVPVAAGVVVGRRSLRTVPRLSSLRRKAGVAALAAVMAALLVGLLDVVGGGSLGAYRLADLGAPALTMTGLLAVELLVGALAAVVWDVWRLHRR